MTEPVPLDVIKPTPGTPEKLTVNHPEFEHELVNTIYIQVLPDNLGDVYFGRENLNVATKTGIIAILRPPTVNHLPDVVFNIPDSGNPYRLSAFRVDVDNPNDGIRPSFSQL